MNYFSIYELGNCYVSFKDIKAFLKSDTSKMFKAMEQYLEDVDQLGCFIEPEKETCSIEIIFHSGEPLIVRNLPVEDFEKFIEVFSKWSDFASTLIENGKMVDILQGDHIENINKRISKSLEDVNASFIETLNETSNLYRKHSLKQSEDLSNSLKSIVSDINKSVLPNLEIVSSSADILNEAATSVRTFLDTSKE